MDLSIFDNIEIQNITRLCEEDLKAVQKLQEDFNKDRDFHFKLKELIENEFEGKEDLFEHGDFTKNKLREFNYSAFMDRGYKFKSNIYRYFNEKYNCNLGKNGKNNIFFMEKEDREYNACNERGILKSNDLLAKYENLNYEDIVDDIFDELGGTSFEDKKTEELQQFLKDKTKQFDEVTIKNRKITINDYFHLDYFDLRYGTTRICSDNYSSIEKLIESISIFNDNKLNVKEFAYNMRNNDGQIINTYEWNLDKTKSIKFFKNGRIDITFTSNKNAIEYANKFLSYEV